MKTIRLLVVASIAFLCSSGAASAQLRPELYASGLSQPVGFVQDPSQSNVQVVVEQAGRIRVIQNGVLLAEPFLDISSQVMNDGERGLLGLVFAPDYAASGRVYVQFTDVLGNTVVSRFLRDSADALRLDRSTRFDLVWPGGLAYLEQPWSTHKGGNLMFGPDGYLYLGLGDGDRGNGPLNLAQTRTSLLGKMLRLDVSVDLAHPTGYSVPPTNPFVGFPVVGFPGVPGVLPEIWSFGLRNPWRFSFDDPTRGGTGALIIADVGEAGWEEVNYEPAGRGGRNYGWRNREGAHDNILTLEAFGPLTDPIHEYSHQVGRSITGGFVYRGTALGAGYVGRYFFADIIMSRVWSLGLAIDGSGEASATDLQEHTVHLGGAARTVSTFGVDASGELYLVSYGQGEISRLVLDGVAPPPPTSCTTTQPGFDWVCAHGNWYPPGMPIPGEPPNPPIDPPTDPPSDPPTDPGPPIPPGPPVGECPTVQPGADWVCANGNWYPPGMVIPSGPPAPPPPPPPPGPEDPPAPPPPPPDPPTPSVCPTVQPGADWVCANGNWYPPGMVIPSGPPAPPQPPLPPPPPPPGEPADPPPPPPPTVESSCATPDPFVAIPGLIGLCIDGNWIPVELVSGAGTVRFQNLGFWAIEMDDGRIFATLGAFPVEFRTEGRRVTVTGKPRPDVVSAMQVAIIEIISIN